MFKQRRKEVYQQLIDFFDTVEGRVRAFNWVHPTTKERFVCKMNADTYEWEYEDHGPGVPADSDDEPEDTPIVGMSVAIIEAAMMIWLG